MWHFLFQLHYTTIPEATLSEETAQPTVYHHLSQLSVDIQSSGLIKCREDSSVQRQLTQVIFRSLSCPAGYTCVSCIKTVDSGDIKLNDLECQLSPLS